MIQAVAAMTIIVVVITAVSGEDTLVAFKSIACYRTGLDIQPVAEEVAPTIFRATSC